MGIDIIGKLPLVKGTFQYAVVAPSLFCHFGVPRHITIDSGTQFDSQDFRNYCQNMGIQLCFALVRHPQLNGVVERANGIICTGISKCLVGLPKGK